MTRAEAVKRLQRIYGAAAGYRVDVGAATGDQRAEAQEKLRTVRVEFEAAGKAMSARAAELAAADEQYQKLKAEYEKLKAEKSTLTGKLMSFKFTGGYMAYGFFHVDAQADTWEQVFNKLKEKYPSGKR